MWTVGDLCAESLDRRLFEAIHEDSNNPAFDALFPLVNSLGDSRVVMGGVFLTVLLGDEKTRDTGILVGAGFVASMAVTESLKRIVHRRRPLQGVEHGSMPSGHATAAFAVATVLSHRYPRWRAAFYGMAAGVGFARVYLGRHYPSDVLVGAAVGTLASRLVLTQEAKLLSVRF